MRKRRSIPQSRHLGDRVYFNIRPALSLELRHVMADFPANPPPKYSTNYFLALEKMTNTTQQRCNDNNNDGDHRKSS